MIDKPGPLERRLLKVVKLDTPRGMDLLHALAVAVDKLVKQSELKS